MIVITPQKKDSVLFYLRDNSPLEQLVYVGTKELLEITELDFQTLRAILYQFERFDFLEELGVGQENTTFILNADLHDFAHKGGFAVQEEIFKSNLDKLGLEIDNLVKQLGPDYLDKTTKISSIISTLLTAIALIPRR